MALVQNTAKRKLATGGVALGFGIASCMHERRSERHIKGMSEVRFLARPVSARPCTATA